jgi:hypothetical protein
MADEFMDKLRTEWRDQDTGALGSRPRLPRGRFTPHLSFAFEVAICSATFVIGLLFVRRALDTGTPIYAYAAAALIATSCALVAALFDARRSSFAWRDETPAQLVRTGVERAEATLRAIRVGRWHVLAIAAFVVLLWGLELTGRLGAGRFLILYSLLCVALTAAAWVWLGRGERTARRRVAAYRELLAEYDLDAGGEG